MSGRVGPVDVFDSSVEEWASYIERLEQYCLAYDIKKERKVAVLLSAMGPTTYNLLRSLTAPTKPAQKSFTEIVQVIQTHLDSKPLLITARYRFHKRNQQNNESISDYITQLRQLAELCQFGEGLSDALRDRLVFGLHTESTQKRLLAEKDLTLTRALEIAMSMETTGKDALEQQGNTTVHCQDNKITTQPVSKVQSYQGNIPDAWMDEPTDMMSHDQFLHQGTQSTFTEQTTEDNQSVDFEEHHSDNMFAEQTNAARVRLSTGRLLPDQCTPAERAIFEMLGELQLQVQHLTAVVTQTAPSLDNGSLKQTPLAPANAEDDGLPLESIQALKDMDIKLQHGNFKQRMVSKLSLAGGQTLKKTVWRICEKVFAPQLAVQLNWCGRGEKMALKNTRLKDTIISSALKNPLLPSPNEAETEKIIKEWLRLSGDRLKKRHRFI